MPEMGIKPDSSPRNKEVIMQIYQVDSFTDKPFSGNPAGVCILQEPKSEEWMRLIAMEMNLSETAFLVKQEEGYSLRWFTPRVEVDLCGHATLASAHILWQKGYLQNNEPANFHTKSGLLTCVKKQDWIEMNFPSNPDEKIGVRPDFEKAFGVKIKYLGKSRFDYIAELESEKDVRNTVPNFEMLIKLPARGIMITSISESKEYDFVSRFFAPNVGVTEDPVTGSAHTTLGPFWSRKLSKNELIAYQASERGGILKLNVKKDRIYIAGQAITVLECNLLV